MKYPFHGKCCLAAVLALLLLIAFAAAETVRGGDDGFYAAPITDEIFALSVLADGPLRPAYSYGLITVSVTGWVMGTVLGAAAGAILPHRLISALGVALYGMFIAIIIPPARDEKPVRITVIFAMILSTLFAVIPVIKSLSGGMKIIIVTVAVASFSAILMPRDEDGDGKEAP